MDIHSINDVQKQFFQSVIQKIVARNQCTPSELESMQKLMDNVRDSKHFHLIMEKLRECGQIELDNFDENFKEGSSELLAFFFHVNGRFHLPSAHIRSISSTQKNISKKLLLTFFFNFISLSPFNMTLPRMRFGKN